MADTNKFSAFILFLDRHEAEESTCRWTTVVMIVGPVLSFFFYCACRNKMSINEALLLVIDGPFFYRCFL